jgi:glycosyltransferase involved in cell wall biosynthesis
LEGSRDGTRLWDENESVSRGRGWSRKFGKFALFVKTARRRLVDWLFLLWQIRFLAGKNESFEILTLRNGKELVHRHPWFRWADVVHLHWTAGFLSYSQKWDRKKWVVSLHDCFPFTAVCHFPADCRGFESGCHSCPQLVGSRNPAYSKRAFLWKKKGYPADPCIVLHAPSRWIADEASRSELLGAMSARVLPNLVPTKIFRARDMAVSRDLFDLPQNKRLALFVAGYIDNTRKGFRYFRELAESMTDSAWAFVIVGGGTLPSLPGNCRALGSLSDLRLMSALYSASDVFVSTTLQDTVPATVIESQLCGTPVIGFAVGGQGEMIEQGRTGWLYPSVCVEGLSRGMEWFEKTPPSRDYIGQWAHSRWDEDELLAQWSDFYRGL